MKNYKGIDDKKLSENYIPAKRDDEGNVIESGYFEVSAEELKAVKRMGHGGARSGAGRKSKNKTLITATICKDLSELLDQEANKSAVMEEALRDYYKNRESYKKTKH